MNRAPLLALTLIVVVAGCAKTLSREDLYDPENCRSCHESHVDEWQMSMHAYAAEDPVFRAMNARGQEETNGELGTFCVQCHAPLAVALGETEDGLDLDDLPQHLQGVNCAFCHLAHESEGDSNNPIELDPRNILKGPFDAPTTNEAHRSEYSPMLDRGQRESTDLCGPCHDIVLANGVHLEQTFAEWQGTVFAEDLTLTTCGNCHMRGSDTDVPVADVEGVPLRQRHDHTMPGVDVALTPWPGRAEHEAAVQAALEDTVRTELCVNNDPPGWRVVVGLENVKAGHSFPSGSSADRRVWVELEAYSGKDLLWTSGVVPEGQAATSLISPADGILLRDIVRNRAGEEVHMFWEVEQDPERNVLPGIAMFGFEEIRVFDFGVPLLTPPDRVTLRIFERPVGLDVLDDLIGSGHLDPAIREAMPTFELTEGAIEWSGTLGTCVASDDQIVQ